jgi:tryptophan aminotransferase
MLAGKPNPSTFPITSISLTVRSPNPTLDPTETEITICDQDIATSLQYGPTAGMPELIQWITELVSQIHRGSLDEGWRVMIGPGSQDLLYKVFLALIDPGDTVLVEAPTYP